LGYGLALFAVRTWGADLGARMFSGIAPQLDPSPLAALGYFAAGMLVAIVGALLPALDAARTPPARALKAGDEQTLFTRGTAAWPGIALIVLGLVLAQLRPVNGLPIFG